MFKAQVAIAHHEINDSSVRHAGGTWCLPENIVCVSCCVCLLPVLVWSFGAETLYVTYTTVVVTNTKYIFDVAQYNPLSEDYEETSLIRTPFIYPITLFRR